MIDKYRGVNFSKLNVKRIKILIKIDNNYSIKVYWYTNIYGNKIFILLVQIRASWPSYTRIIIFKKYIKMAYCLNYSLFKKNLNIYGTNVLLILNLNKFLFKIHLFWKLFQFFMIFMNKKQTSLLKDKIKKKN